MLAENLLRKETQEKNEKHDSIRTTHDFFPSVVMCHQTGLTYWGRNTFTNNNQVETSLSKDSKYLVNNSKSASHLSMTKSVTVRTDVTAGIGLLKGVLELIRNSRESWNSTSKLFHFISGRQS